MRHGGVVLALLTLCALPAFAQTTARNLEWDIIGAVPTEVATYTTAIVLDGNPVTQPPACVPKGSTDTTCKVPIPPIDPNAAHTLTITNTKGDETAQMVQTGKLGGVKAAGRARVNVTVTVNVQ